MNNSNLPLVSIVIPNYNRAKWIGKTLSSSLEQDYLNLEIIVSDDASTDNSHDIIEEYARDPRIKYTRNVANIGMVENFSKVFFELAKGEYVMQVGSDDYLLEKSFISKAIALINKYPGVLLVFGKYNTLVEATGEIITDNSGDYATEFKEGTQVFLEFPKNRTFGWGGALMHRKKFEEQEPFKTNISSMDHLANLKLMLLGNVAFIDEPVYLFRMHVNQASQNMEVEQFTNNFISISAPYELALAIGTIPKQKLDLWQDQLSYHYAKYRSIQLAPNGAKNYKSFISFVKRHFPGGYKMLMRDMRWRGLIFFFRRPKFSLKLFSIISRSKHNYLLSLKKQ